jgi:FkbM family methyltransferase
MKLKIFGTDYGGFYYPDDLFSLDKDSVIYCIGAGEDISHDIMIANKLKSKVYIVDPTPRAITHTQYVKDVLDNKKEAIDSNRYGGSAKNYWELIKSNSIPTDKIIFKDVALDIVETKKKFYFPNNPEWVSCSLVYGMKGDKYTEVQTKTLKNLMDEFGHSEIDLLKIDIEGSECDVIDYMFSHSILPKYLSVDFDLINKDRNRVNQTVNKLNQKYKILKISGQDVSFIRKDIFSWMDTEGQLSKGSQLP